MEFKNLKITHIEVDVPPSHHHIDQEAYAFFTFSRQVAPHVGRDFPIALPITDPIIPQWRDAFTHGKSFTLSINEDTGDVPPPKTTPQPLYTADQARQVAGGHASEQYAEIIGAIQSAAKKGNRRVLVYNSLFSTETIDLLIYGGFVVYAEPSECDGKESILHTITW